jgi:acetate kinase
MNILVFNAGSSSLKFSLFAAGAGIDAPLAGGQIDWAGGDRGQAKLTVGGARGNLLREVVSVPDDAAAGACALRAVGNVLRGTPEGEQGIGTVGHRVVHTGAAFREAAVIDDRVVAAIERFCDIAPLHNPPSLAVIRFAQGALPDAAQVAVFDTAFFAGLSPRAYVYPVPWEWHERFGTRRFGFHGISHQYCTARAAELVGRDVSALRIVSCHLGGGCSAAAIDRGTPVASTMGFTPLEGLMMGTRCGSIDPGILLYLQRERGLSLSEIDDALNHGSGLLGVSGVSPDMAQIEKAAQGGDERAQLALDLFTDRVRAAIASMAVTMGGLDVLLFTDRVGESAAVRAAACRGLECLGVHLDPARNDAAAPDAEVSSAESPVRVLVIRTQEEVMIAREAARVAGPANKKPLA